MSNIHHIRTKLVCRVCVDGYANENLELGVCCGMTMREVPWTKEDYENERRTREAFLEILAKNISWD